MGLNICCVVLTVTLSGSLDLWFFVRELQAFHTDHPFLPLGGRELLSDGWGGTGSAGEAGDVASGPYAGLLERLVVLAIVPTSTARFGGLEKKKGK